jgi:hypothetical protein
VYAGVCSREREATGVFGPIAKGQWALCILQQWQRAGLLTLVCKGSLLVSADHVVGSVLASAGRFVHTTPQLCATICWHQLRRGCRRPSVVAPSVCCFSLSLCLWSRAAVKVIKVWFRVVATLCAAVAVAAVLPF